MNEKDFIYSKDIKLNGVVKWSAPSNIAIVKYWGKLENQIPQNPSISLTLSKSITNTSLSLTPKKNKISNLHFEFEGEKQESFEKKTLMFLNKILMGINLGWKPHVVSYGFLVFSIVQIPMALIFVYHFDMRIYGIFYSVGIAYATSIVILIITAWEKIKKDFQAASISVEETEIRNQMEKALSRAKEDFKK